VTITGYTKAKTDQILLGYTKKRPGWADVKDFGAIGDGVADDAPAVVAAQASLGATGGVVYFPPGRYRLASTVPIATQVTYRGASAVASVITSTTAIEFLFRNSGSGNLADVSFEQLGFAGNAVLPALFPTRARSQFGAAARTAIMVNAKAYTPANPAADGVTVRDCRFSNFIAPPVSLLGVSGRAIMDTNVFFNCMDPGYVHCEEVVFTDNLCEKSSDNGVSISRATARVVCTGNVAADCAFSGLFVAGWVGTDNAGLVVSEPGPSVFEVTGNTVSNCGWYGIQADNGPQIGTITGNTIDTVSRGPIDGRNDAFGHGIFLNGYPAYPATSTQLARLINVGDNTISNAAKFGIAMVSVQGIKVHDNTLFNIGSDFQADGATAVPASDPNQNVGIFIGSPASNNNLEVVDNFIFDTRGASKRTNFGVAVSNSGGSPVNFIRRGNTERGMRNATTEHVLTYSRSAAGETAALAALRQELASMGLISDLTTA